MNSTTGVSEIQFLIARGLPPGFYDVIVLNKVGTIRLTSGFQMK